MSSRPTWKREHHERINVARSPVYNPQQLNRRYHREFSHDTNSKTLPAKWTSRSTTRSRPNNLYGNMGDIPSLASSQRYVMTPMTGQMPTRRATETAMEETDDVLLMDMVKLQSDGGICLGAFGDVGKMTAKTVDFLIHVLEDRKQELVMNGEDKNGSERTSDAGKDDTSKEGKDSSVSRIFSFDTTTNDGADVTELVRSHSYEALVQLEEILEARHNRLMSDGMLESTDDRVD